MFSIRPITGVDTFSNITAARRASASATSCGVEMITAPSSFVRCTSVQQISAAGLRSLRPVVTALADAEGLLAHRRAVEVRQ